MKLCYLITSLLFSGTIISAQTYSVEPRVRLIPDTAVSDVQITDIDGDGKPDILASNPTLHILMVFHNKSTTGRIDTASFAAPEIYQTGPQPSLVAVDDIDGDGKPDIVLINIGYADTLNKNNALTLFRNLSTPGNITLSAVPLTDSSDSISIEYCFRLKPGDNVIRVSDFNGDGKPDISVLNTGGFISIYCNKYKAGQSLKSLLSQPITVAVPHHPTSFTVGDFDADGKPDIVTTDYDNASISVLRNNSIKGLTTSSSFECINLRLEFHPLTATLNDVDGDGKPDAIIGQADNQSAVLIHNTSKPRHVSGTIISFSKLNLISNYNDDIIIQDMNGDSKIDLLSLNADLNSVYLYINKSTPGQTSPDYFNNIINFPVITIPDCIGDLDGDGSPDIIVASNFGIDIYQMKSSPLQISIIARISAAGR